MTRRNKATGLHLALAALLALLPVTASAEDWEAVWIGAPWDGEQFDRGQVRPAPEFRKTFSLRPGLKSATARVTGLGFFEFAVNGVKAGDEVLCPNETSYGHRPGLPKGSIPMDDTNWREFRVPYLVHDITDLLHEGVNELRGLVGNGFYAIGSRRWVEPYGTPRFICQVDLEYSDGSTGRVVSDCTWMVAPSPIVQNDLYLGEIFDAGKSEGRGWLPAVERKAPDGALYPQDGPADKVMEVLSPISVGKTDDGRWEVDFGEYVTGWVKLMDLTAPAGTVIEVEHPIECAGNGIYRYIADGRHVDAYAPRFCWWAFDKVIVSGWPGELTPSNICAEVVHSDVREISRFACSNPMLNRIDAIWRRTQTDNMHLGVATDCPHREKGPYTGDGEVACAAVMSCFDADAFYRKWLRDMYGCQDKVTGYVPNGAPWHPGCGGGVAWGAAMNVIPWEHYRHYGDISVLEENYPYMKEQLRHMLSWRLPDGTMLQEEKGAGGASPCYWMNLGEWCAPYSLPSANLVHTWYLWRCADYTVKAASALGFDDECEEYRSLAEEVKAAFHRKFYNPMTGSYGGDDPRGDGSNVFALAMGVPEGRRDAVVSALKAELKANGCHLNTGIYGSALFFEQLCGCGMEEEAYAAMTSTTYPGFGYWLEQGAKTTWEQWDGGNSHNHPMFGGALTWLYSRICGVLIDDGKPGFRHFTVRPRPVGDLTWAEYEKETPHGTLSLRWDRTAGGRFVLKLTVPPGTTATVLLPDGSRERTLGPGRHRLSCRMAD